MIFGQAGLADGNPNPFRWMMLASLSGTGLIPGRSLDRVGVAYFRYAFSRDLPDGLRVFGLAIGDEYGGEIFYHAAVTPWLRLTGDLQSIRPGVHNRDTAMVTGVSAHIKF